MSTLLEKVEHKDGTFIYRNLDTHVLYRLVTKARIMPDVLLMSDGVLEAPRPFAIFFYGLLLSAPVLAAIVLTSVPGFRAFLQCGFVVWWLMLTPVLICEINYKIYWKKLVFEEVEVDE